MRWVGRATVGTFATSTNLPLVFATQPEDIRWLKKEFVSVWKSTPADVKSLPQPLRF